MKRTAVMKLSLVAGFILSLSLSGCAPVTLSSDPEGAGVYDKGNDKLLGETPLTINLLANDRELVVRKSGYFSKTVVLSTIDPENITVELSPLEKVLLLSNPEGAELFVEGVGRIGRTPFRMDYNKPWRTFEVKAPGYAPRLYTVPEDPEGDITIDLEREDSVLIVSKPKKAQVFSDEDELLGTTPLAVPAGEEFLLELRKDGYYNQKCYVDEETESPFLVELVREPIVIVYSEPSGAEVVHRGVTLGITPYRQLVQEDMDVEIRFDRFIAKQLTIAPDSPREVQVALDPMPYVTILSEPEGAKLYRAGGIELLGTTPVEVLIERDTAFEIHKEGFDIKPFTLSSESNSEVVVPLKQTISAVEKIVTIDSKPSGAKVYRPGGAELIGTTPLEQHVREERTFELQLDGFKTKIVTVAPDSADSVVFALAGDESARNSTVSDPLLNTPSSF